MLEQQFRCPAHLIRSFGPLPDGSRPMKCIGMSHGRRANDTAGGWHFGAAETKKTWSGSDCAVSNLSDCLHRTVSRTKARCQTFFGYMKQI
ncbi:hypothetical protein BC2230_10771 [Burkholderia cepacia]